jgi:hypothetical protein
MPAGAAKPIQTAVSYSGRFAASAMEERGRIPVVSVHAVPQRRKAAVGEPGAHHRRLAAPGRTGDPHRGMAARLLNRGKQAMAQQRADRTRPRELA